MCMNNNDKKNNFPKKENFSASPKSQQRPLNNDFKQSASQFNGQINGQNNQSRFLKNKINRENGLNNKRAFSHKQPLSNANNGFSDKIKQKAVKDGAKIAANSVAGPAGGKAVDALSKTKIEFIPEEIVGSEYNIQKTTTNITNIRLYKEEIPEKDQENDLLTYNIKWSNKSIILDSADIIIKNHLPTKG